jgi:hypothetical protein
VYIARLGTGTGAAVGGTLAVTGTDSLFGWYALIGVTLVVTGLILLRGAALRRRRQRTETV